MTATWHTIHILCPDYMSHPYHTPMLIYPLQVCLRPQLICARSVCVHNLSVYDLLAIRLRSVGARWRSVWIPWRSMAIRWRSVGVPLALRTDVLAIRMRSVTIRWRSVAIRAQNIPYPLPPQSLSQNILWNIAQRLIGIYTLTYWLISYIYTHIYCQLIKHIWHFIDITCSINFIYPNSLSIYIVVKRPKLSLPDHLQMMFRLSSIRCAVVRG